MNLLLCEPEELSPDGRAEISGQRAEHLRKILKLNPGDSVTAGVIGRGTGRAEIEELGPGYARLKLTISNPPESLYPLSLAVGMVRPIQTRRILKTAAAFGIQEVLFVPTALGENSYREAKIWGEYRNFLVEGASQGGICSLPEVIRYGSLEEFLEGTSHRDGRILFDLADGPAAPSGKSEEAVILIGSERGWTEKERRRILDAGFELRGLGRRILTTETACTAATALTLRELDLF
jgi:16S rRNA (uracil1498-N3)-methyltransferase